MEPWKMQRNTYPKPNDLILGKSQYNVCRKLQWEILSVALFLLIKIFFSWSFTLRHRPGFLETSLKLGFSSMQLSESAHLEKPVRKWSQMGKEKGTRKDVFSTIVLQCSLCSTLILRERALAHKPYCGVPIPKAMVTIRPPLTQSHW